jgi:hypothetical protein
MEQVAAAKIVLSATGVEQNTLRYILVWNLTEGMSNLLRTAVVLALHRIV